MSDLPQQITINQYVADGVATIYTYNYLVPLDVDINVYVTPVGQPAIPMVDIKILNTDYTVQNAGNITGGTITFISGAPASGAIVTLVRNVQNQIDTEFVEARNINGQNLDDSFEREMLCIQQNTTYLQKRVLQYPINTYLPITSDDIDLPKLGDQQIWQKVGGAIQAVTLEENPDVSTLRSQLASQLPMSDGVSLLGYYDVNNTAPQTLQTFLNNLPTYIANLINNITTPTGAKLVSYNSSTPAGGWLPLDGSIATIGSATSGADYANAAAANLFAMFWNQYSNALCPVSGGRGANAAADFAANKTLTIPDETGRVSINQGGGTYTAGDPVGSATQTLTDVNNGPHTHGVTYNGSPAVESLMFHSATAGNDSLLVSSGQEYIGGSITIDSQGSGTPFSIIPPAMPNYVYIKL